MAAAVIEERVAYLIHRWLTMDEFKRLRAHHLVYLTEEIVALERAGRKVGGICEVSDDDGVRQFSVIVGCVHCGQMEKLHAGKKCLFEPTFYEEG